MLAYQFTMVKVSVDPMTECRRQHTVIASQSDGPRFRQYRRKNRRRQVARRSHIDPHAEQRFQLNLKPAKIEQGGTRKRVDQEVQIAVLAVGAPGDRAIHARVCRTVTPDGCANRKGLLSERK